jgi:hypothetical protein
LAKAPLGGVAEAAKTFVLPDGGPGAQAMSPGLAGLGGGRFLLTWSEGRDTHQVRGQSLNADGSPLGGGMTLSAPSANAGQPQVAVGPDGRGVVAYLAAKGKAYEVHATPIACAAK